MWAIRKKLVFIQFSSYFLFFLGGTLAESKKFQRMIRFICDFARNLTNGKIYSNYSFVGEGDYSKINYKFTN